MIPSRHHTAGSNTARLPVFRTTSETHGRRAATAIAASLSVEDASPCELARVATPGRGHQFTSPRRAGHAGEPESNNSTESGEPPGEAADCAGEPRTLLQAYLNRNGIPAAWVEKEGPFARETLRRWRLGEVEMRRKQMVRVLGTLRRITRRPVRMEEIFDLDPDNPDNWRD